MKVNRYLGSKLGRAIGGKLTGFNLEGEKPLMVFKQLNDSVMFVSSPHHPKVGSGSGFCVGGEGVDKRAKQMKKPPVLSVCSQVGGDTSSACPTPGMKGQGVVLPWRKQGG